jgi:hypothetical protein
MEASWKPMIGVIRTTAENLMAGDLISLGFMNSPQDSALIENSKSISEITVNNCDAILFVGGKGKSATDGTYPVSSRH